MADSIDETFAFKNLSWNFQIKLVLFDDVYFLKEHYILSQAYLEYILITLASKNKCPPPIE
jgi:hypothetical protein